jgi:hypothetical protein
VDAVRARVDQGGHGSRGGLDIGNLMKLGEGELQGFYRRRRKMQARLHWLRTSAMSIWTVFGWGSTSTFSIDVPQAVADRGGLFLEFYRERDK